jgi:hypothetical protein
MLALRGYLRPLMNGHLYVHAQRSYLPENCFRANYVSAAATFHPVPILRYCCSNGEQAALRTVAMIALMTPVTAMSQRFRSPQK